MTSDHPVRRVLARFCSPATMARVVDPTLADARFEDGRLTWRGSLALARALVVHAILTAPGTIAQVFSDDKRAIPRTALWSLAGAVFGALLLAGLARPRLLGSTPPAVPILAQRLAHVPGALVLTLPAALLIAIPLTLRRLEPSARLIRRIVLLSVLYAGVTFATIGWIMPATNQAFRVAMSGISDVPRGPGERTLTEMRRDLRDLRTSGAPQSLVRSLEYDYETRLALAAAAVPIGFAALASAFSPFGRRRPILVGGLGFVAYAALIIPLYGVGAMMARATTIPSGSCAWLPNATAIMIAGALTATVVRDYATGRHHAPDGRN